MPKDSDYILPDDFDPQLYLSINRDVEMSGMDPRHHYLEYGIAEGRTYKLIEAPIDLVGASSGKTEQSVNWRVKSADIISNLYSPKVIAFYLPQYHRIVENDTWWGQGFTEWTNVRKATANYVGHEQPKIPGELGYYNLLDENTHIRQANLAQEYGIKAFCYYAYWFDGRRVLEKPLQVVLDNPEIDIEFCVCWANENWTRTWDGKANDILLEQSYSEGFAEKFIDDMVPYFRDPRYLRVDGKLMLLVYRVDLLPDCVKTVDIWRRRIRELGLGELHLCAVQFYGITSPIPWGFDAAVEFPPHGWLTHANLPETPPSLVNPSFTGSIFDYDRSVDWALSKRIPDYTWYRGVFPSWDNTARRQDTSHIFANSNPLSFERWLTGVLRQTVLMAKPENQIVFINAWNEWGEGAFLEPDRRHGRLNLQAVNSALQTVTSEREPLAILKALRTATETEERSRLENELISIIRASEQSLRYFMYKSRSAV